MKCSQCGCEDLAKVDFPQKTKLVEIECGLRGYSASYDFQQKTNCDTYICLNCGHYEFFNLKAANQIKRDRETKK